MISDLRPLVGMKELTIHLVESQQVKVPKNLQGRVERKWYPSPSR